MIIFTFRTANYGEKSFNRKLSSTQKEPQSSNNTINEIMKDLKFKKDLNNSFSFKSNCLKKGSEFFKKRRNSADNFYINFDNQGLQSLKEIDFNMNNTFSSIRFYNKNSDSPASIVLKAKTNDSQPIYNILAENNLSNNSGKRLFTTNKIINLSNNQITVENIPKNQITVENISKNQIKVKKISNNQIKVQESQNKSTNNYVIIMIIILIIIIILFFIAKKYYNKNYQQKITT